MFNKLGGALGAIWNRNAEEKARKELETALVRREGISDEMRADIEKHCARLEEPWANDDKIYKKPHYRIPVKVTLFNKNNEPIGTVYRYSRPCVDREVMFNRYALIQYHGRGQPLPYVIRVIPK